MENKKNIVTVQDGTETRIYKGDFVNIQAFTAVDGGMNMKGESVGTNCIPPIVIDGAMESVQKMILEMGQSDCGRKHLLAIAAANLLKCMMELDGEPAEKMEAKPSAVIRGGGTGLALKELLEVMN